MNFFPSKMKQNILLVNIFFYLVISLFFKNTHCFGKKIPFFILNIFNEEKHLDYYSCFVFLLVFMEQPFLVETQPREVIWSQQETVSTNTFITIAVRTLCSYTTIVVMFIVCVVVNLNDASRETLPVFLHLKIFVS